MVERGPIRGVPFQRAHLVDMQPRLKKVYEGETDQENFPLEAFATTFFQDGIPIAIIGAKPLHRGVFAVWAFTTDDVKKHPFVFHRMVRDLIDFWFDYAQLNRMQMSVRVGYPEGWKWAVALGFRCEGTMKKYHPTGSDCWLFARTK